MTCPDPTEPSTPATVKDGPDWSREADRISVAYCMPPGVLVDQDMVILELRGETAPYLRLRGAPPHPLLQFVHEGLRLEVRDLLRDSGGSGSAVQRRRVQLSIEEEVRELELCVLPIPASGVSERCFLVLFDERPRTGPPRAPEALDSSYEHLLSVHAQQEVTNDELRRANEGLEDERDSLQILNDELTVADQRKDEFLAMIGHELRNPLAPLRHALRVLRLAGDNAAPTLAMQEIMERQVRQLTRLVEDLLDLSRMGLGRLELHRESVDFGRTVEEAVELERSLAGSKGHQITLHLPDHPVLLDADPVRIGQIIGNLLTNALKYTDPDGRIDLRVRQQDRCGVLDVCDEGIGISAELLPRLFDLFAQADGAAARSRGGLGIGLAIVRRLVEMHAGTVEAFSEGTGRGSRFTVRLPLALDPAS